VPLRPLEEPPMESVDQPVKKSLDVETPIAQAPDEAPLDGDLVLQVGDRRIVVPESIKELRLPDRAMRAAVEVDPVSKEVRIVLG